MTFLKTACGLDLLPFTCSGNGLLIGAEPVRVNRKEDRSFHVVFVDVIKKNSQAQQHGVNSSQAEINNNLPIVSVPREHH